MNKNNMIKKIVIMFVIILIAALGFYLRVKYPMKYNPNGGPRIIYGLTNN